MPSQLVNNNKNLPLGKKNACHITNSSDGGLDDH